MIAQSCIDGHGYTRTHFADGWLTSEGRRIQPMCGEHGQAVVDEYAEKLGEHWTLTSDDAVSEAAS